MSPQPSPGTKGWASLRAEHNKKRKGSPNVDSDSADPSFLKLVEQVKRLRQQELPAESPVTQSTKFRDAARRVIANLFVSGKKTRPGPTEFSHSEDQILPQPRGPYPVSVVEVDIPVHASKIGIVPCAVFYPTSTHVVQGPIDADKRDKKIEQVEYDEARHKRPTWMDHNYAAALGKSQLAPLFGESLASLLMDMLGPIATRHKSVDAILGLPMAIPPVQGKQGTATVTEDGDRKTMSEGRGRGDGTWPVAVLSHSMTGWRWLYSAKAISLASEGVVVVVPEHCDGTASACFSSLKRTPLIEYEEWSDMNKLFESRDGCTFEENQKLGNIWRQGQAEQRVLEIHACLDNVEETLLRQCPHVLPSTKNTSVYDGSSSAPEIDCKCLRTKEDVLVMGHSFGGTVATICAIRDKERQRFSHVFAYDPWLGSLSKYRLSPLSDEDRTNIGFSQAMRSLVIWGNTLGFVWAPGASIAEQMIASVGEDRGRIILAEGAGHFHQTDAVTLFENGPLSFVYQWLKGTDKSKTLPAREALDAFIRQSIDELRRTRWLH
mmetsp:Transcript_3330/g.12053  ORF Transcript_3330/g.12053 Transcript_3330/m.12053 type:complete len:549 (+) Transcript_3330:104-1750(+)